ncbi:Os11g0250900, partial [Oryza sativa Japonica Group]
ADGGGVLREHGAARRRGERWGAFSDTPWFVEFAKMARHVWLLHCLFLTFDGGVSTIFQAAAGGRYGRQR